MREPAFWYRPRSFKSHVLRPLGLLYGAITERRMLRQGFDAGIPVILSLIHISEPTRPY